MDVGVGCFVVVNGASWPQTRPTKRVIRQLAAPLLLFTLGMSARWVSHWNCVVSSRRLLVAVVVFVARLSDFAAQAAFAGKAYNQTLPGAWDTY
jgi:hypothetical protein